MAKNKEAYFLSNDVYTRTQFVNADGTTIKDICTAGADGSYVYMINITSTDTVTRNISLFLNDGVNDIPIKVGIILAINQGNVASTPDPLRLIQANIGFVVTRILDRDQNYYIPLPAGWKLRARADAAISPSSAITILVHRKDF